MHGVTLCGTFGVLVKPMSKAEKAMQWLWQAMYQNHPLCLCMAALGVGRIG
jgi:hypothetical protein